MVADSYVALMFLVNKIHMRWRNIQGENRLPRITAKIFHALLSTLMRTQCNLVFPFLCILAIIR